MRRIITTERPGWQRRVEEQGFNFHTSGVQPGPFDYGTFWNEKVYWEFSAAEVDRIEAATNELHRICCEAVVKVSADPDLMTRMGIPEHAHIAIKDSVEQEHPSIYGRFDLAFDGVSEPKMLEYNADTPTTLIESAVVQWWWVKDKFGEEGDQFNSIHDRLIEAWKSVADYGLQGPIYFASNSASLEEFATTEYMRDLAHQAGVHTEVISMANIGHNPDIGFVDLNDRAMRHVFKLYPWEWMWAEAFGNNVANSRSTTSWIEPPWKTILSNKAILPILWEMFPNHANLLESRWDKPNDVGKMLYPQESWYGKPIHGREGQNIVFTSKDVNLSTGGEYDGPKIWQKAANTLVDGTHVVLGSWVVGAESAGMIVREDPNTVIVDKSAVVPHRLIP